MDMSRSAEIIRMMKGIPGGRGVKFPVRDGNMNVIGYLRGFDEFCLRDAALIEMMARARTTFKEFFLTQFDVTPENKRDWLEHSVLKNDNKMLFLAETADGKIVGQDGFTLFDDGAFMLDGTIRWARGGHTCMFERSGFERASMGFFLFGRDLCRVSVFKSNKWAIPNIESMGFVMRKEYALSRTESDGKIIFAAEDDAVRVNTEETLLEYCLDKKGFAERNGAVVDSPCWQGII